MIVPAGNETVDYLYSVGGVSETEEAVVRGF